MATEGKRRTDLADYAIVLSLPLWLWATWLQGWADPPVRYAIAPWGILALGVPGLLLLAKEAKRISRPVWAFSQFASISLSLIALLALWAWG